jgi:hypothetical protein
MIGLAFCRSTKEGLNREVFPRLLQEFCYDAIVLLLGESTCAI